MLPPMNFHSMAQIFTRRPSSEPEADSTASEELGGFLGLGQLVAIRVIQAERIAGCHSRVEFFKLAIEQHAHARTGIDTEMKLTLGAALEVLVQSLFPDDLAAAFTLQPQALGAKALFAIARAFVHSGFLAGKPRHKILLLA